MIGRVVVTEGEGSAASGVVGDPEHAANAAISRVTIQRCIGI